MSGIRSAAVVVSIASLIGCGDSSLSSTSRPESTVGLVAASCVEEYSPETLHGRDFAFDGTLVDWTSVGSEATGVANAGYGQATFRVTQWFAGGSADEVTVWLTKTSVPTSVGGGDYKVGTRLLVAGEPRWGGQPLDEPIAWACGFTQPYESDVADTWAQVFASTSH
ncbi:MAG TPA: hypothetical protein VFF32_11910 [Dermatophilaceae bacterium]|nr:hypothetical protein [Dermatophilaceae bacterium]